jgi:RimJ/RimL family protein N-acetyltransferase
LASALFLTPGDAERYARFRMRMLLDSPWAFSSSPEEDLARDPARVAALLAEEEYEILALEDGESGELIASVTVMREKRVKSAHRAAVWGVFVDPAHRGKGLGRAVMAAAIETARGWKGVDWVDLGVSERSPAARALYESLGFRAWGREPEALEVDGRRYDEIFLALRLQPERDR